MQQLYAEFCSTGLMDRYINRFFRKYLGYGAGQVVSPVIQEGGLSKKLTKRRRSNPLPE